MCVWALDGGAPCCAILVLFFPFIHFRMEQVPWQHTVARGGAGEGREGELHLPVRFCSGSAWLALIAAKSEEKKKTNASHNGEKAVSKSKSQLG